jgi:uncharacterized protein (DUF58 family)
MSPPRSDAAAGQAALVDPRALMGIRNLELRARMVVEGFWHGIHRSPYHGFSAEFTEYRQYAPGDDPRYLDWKVLARSDRYFVKKFEDETNLRCYLLVDRSRSMSYGSLTYTKADYAATLAATLATFLYRQGDGVGLIAFDDRVRDYVPPRQRSGHLKRLLHALDAPATGTATDLAVPLDRAADLMRRRSLVILISDFLAPLDALTPRLLSLGAAGHDVVVFQVLDPAETAFTFGDSAVFEDLETGRTVLVDPGQAQTDYLRRLRAHNQSLREICEHQGIACRPAPSDQPLELVLFEFLQARMQQARHVRQRRAP